MPFRPFLPLLVLLAAPACALTRRFDPPALIQPETVLEPDEALARYPVGSELVELESASGATLRGVFVPADPGAPVVLHLLDSGNSVASELVPPSGVAGELADLGLASLLVDYTGVGLSGGKRSVRHLGADAEAAWDEAVARAGGDPARVIVRAVSIGTIAAALLLDSGARPGFQVWVLPVFPDTVAPRFADVTRGALFGLIARGFLRPVADVRIEESVRRAGVPTIVISAAEDELTTAEERASLEAAARASGGRADEVMGGHLLVGLRSRWLLEPEREVFRRLGRPATEERLARLLAALPEELAARFPADGAARERLRDLVALQRNTPDEDVAAAALSPGDPFSKARFLWCLRRRPYDELSFEERVDAYSLCDPAGSLPIELFEQLTLPNELAILFDEFYWISSAEAVASVARGGYPTSVRRCVTLGPALEIEIETQTWPVLAEIVRRVEPESAARRQLARLMLKAERLPDRLWGDDESGWTLEARENGSWHALDLEPRAGEVDFVHAELVPPPAIEKAGE